MMKIKVEQLILVAVLALGATNCQSSFFQSPQPGIEPSQTQAETPAVTTNFIIQNQFNPLPGDESLIRGQAYIDSVELNPLQDALQAELVFSGSLPTPCSQLRLSFLPSTIDKRIELIAYSLTKPDEICAQVLQDFEAAVLLAELEQGDYTVFVDGQEMLRFTVPTGATPGPGDATFTSIVQAILSNPESYAGQQVVVVGYYRGWDLLDEASGQSPVTRSDWVIKDNSGAIYVSAQGSLAGELGLDPSSLAATTTVLRLTGIVRLTSDSQPYIEPVDAELIQ